MSSQPSASMRRSNKCKQKRTGSSIAASNKKPKRSERNTKESPSANNNIPGISPSTSQVLIETLKSFRKLLKRRSSYSLCDFMDSCSRPKMRTMVACATIDKDDAEACAVGNMKRLLRALKTEFTSSSSQKKNPSAVIEFLTNIIYDENGPINVRRPALMILGDLLKRSKDCRDYLLTSTQHMKSMVSSISASTKDQDSSALYQQEAIHFLRQWTQSYSSIYPLLWVATRYLEERRGIFDANTSTSHSSMAARMERLRHGRDSALRNGQSTALRVNEILHQMNIYFDVLVPRFGFDKPDTVPTTSLPSKPLPGNDNEQKEQEKLGEEEEEEDDDEVDWEDGENEITSDCNHSAVQSSHEQHLMAVDQTIQIMAKTGSVFEGELQIDFSSNTNNYDELNQETIASDNEIYTLQMLELFLDILHYKYMPQLSFWIESLITADAMTLQQEISSLVLLPEHLREKRSPTLQMLLALKVNVAKMLSLAKTTIRRHRKQSSNQPQLNAPSMKQESSNIDTSSSYLYPTNRNRTKQVHTKQKKENCVRTMFTKQSRHKIKICLR